MKPKDQPGLRGASSGRPNPARFVALIGGAAFGLCSAFVSASPADKLVFEQRTDGLTAGVSLGSQTDWIAGPPSGVTPGVGMFAGRPAIIASSEVPSSAVVTSTIALPLPEVWRGGTDLVLEFGVAVAVGDGLPIVLAGLGMSSGEIAAHAGIFGSRFMVRERSYGTIAYGHDADGVRIDVEQSTWYRVRAIWRRLPGANGPTVSMAIRREGESDWQSLQLGSTPPFADAVGVGEVAEPGGFRQVNSVWIRIQGPAGLDNLRLSRTESNNDIRLGDVLMRSLNPYPRNESDPKDTLAAADEFGVNRIVWIYENTLAFNESARARGFTMGTTMAINAREAWLPFMTRPEAEAFAATYTVRDLDGNPVVPIQFLDFNDPYVAHFVPDQTNLDWQAFYTDYVEQLYDQGIDTLHRDDAGSTSISIIRGGTFTPATSAYFRTYLASRFSTAELAALGVSDVGTFDVADHFRALGAPTGDAFWQWRGSPLVSVFRRAMEQADADFFHAVKSEVEARTGRSFPWSLNYAGAAKTLESAFDFRIGEFQSHFNQPHTIFALSEYARAAGKVQATVTMVDSSYETNPNFVADTRLSIATQYAMGMIPLVPYDMYMGSAPRYFGPLADFGDLFHFVRANQDLFDEFEMVEATGMWRRTNLYLWLPRRELRFPTDSGGTNLRVNSNNVFAIARKRPGGTEGVIHLVNWNQSPEPFELSFDPSRLIGTEAAEIELLQPNGSAVSLGRFAGGMLTIPELAPWGILVVRPAPDGPVPAPHLAEPLPPVIAEGSVAVFSPPDPGTTVQVRFIPEGSVDEIPFAPLSAARTLELPEAGFVEAYAVRSGIESDVLRLKVETFRDLNIPQELQTMKSASVDLSEQFTINAGEQLVGASYLADTLHLGGEEVVRGFSTRGNTTIDCDIKPEWNFIAFTVGLDDAEDRRPSARIQVRFGTDLVYESPIINPSKLDIQDRAIDREPIHVMLRIPRNADRLRLRVVNSGFFESHNTIVWSNPVALTQAAPEAPSGDPYVLGQDAVFTWDPTDVGLSNPVESYILAVGTSPGANDRFSGNVGTATNASIQGEFGETLFASIQPIYSDGASSSPISNLQGVRLLDPHGDDDGDGTSNAFELAAGTNPLDPNSVFRVSEGALTDEFFTISWPSVLDRSYVIEASGHPVSSTTWDTVTSPIMGTGSILHWQVPIPMETRDATFFRIRILNPNP